MQASGMPTKFPAAFANAAGSGYIRTIPANSQIGISNGAASLNDGFPPVCFLPVGSGGTPPSGQDFNGILNQLSTWSIWQAAGGPVYYDSTFSAAIGGYPLGTILSAYNSLGNFWLSEIDNNVSDPDTGGANWLPFSAPGPASIVHAGVDTGSSDNVQVNSTTPPLLGYTAGAILAIKIAAPNLTGSPRIQIGTGGWLNIGLSDNWNPQPGTLQAGAYSFFILDGAGNAQMIGMLRQLQPTQNCIVIGSTNTYNVPTNVYGLRNMHIWGAGGGGGGQSGTLVAGFGGGGGGFAYQAYVRVTPGSPLVCQVGDGGAGGVGLQSGTSGSNTFITEGSGGATLISASGGGGGGFDWSTGQGVGGVGGGTDLNRYGDDGGYPQWLNGSPNDGLPVGGQGGASPFAGGRTLITFAHAVTGPGPVGRNPGGGGGGGSAMSGSATGGAGGPGLIYFEV